MNYENYDLGEMVLQAYEDQAEIKIMELEKKYKRKLTSEEEEMIRSMYEREAVSLAW